jgi:tetratricopeptide (TPR) repeat protein
MLERALELGGDEPRLLSSLLAPLGIVDGFGSARLRAVQARLLELCDDPDPALLRSLALAALIAGDFAAARRHGDSLAARGRRDRDDVLLVEADYVLGIAAFWQADLDDAVGHFEAAIARYEPAQRAQHLTRYGLDPRVVCESRLANALAFLGRPRQARDARARALAYAREIDHPASTATALVFAVLLALDLGDDDGVRRHTAELAVLQHDVKAAFTAVDGFQGYVDVLDGDAAGGLARIRAAVARSAQGGDAPGQHAGQVHVLIAACAVAGDDEGGLAATAIPVQARVWEPHTQRMRTAFLAGERSRNARAASLRSHDR